MKQIITASLSNSLNSLEQTEFYRLLVNSIQDYAIFLLDPSGNVASWNLGAQKLKGYSASQIIGKHFSIFYPEVDKKNQKPRNELLICDQYGRVEDEGWRVRKDGSRFWANVVITALRDPAGQLIGYAKITRDLTERKKHEDALSQANEQLREQSKVLTEMNKSKDEFISLASHQLRTPATGVKQFLGLVLGGYAGALGDKQKAYVQRAYESNNRQIELVNDLLRVAQVDAGKVNLQMVTLDIGELVRDVIDEQKDSFTKRKQQVITHIPATAVKARMDTMRFRMVLENVIDNASKYTPDGGTITVSVVDETDNVSVIISDTGVGIDRKSLTKLFNKFSRIPNELSESVGGSGLGLYWAHKIMHLHGGDIHVTSTTGQGSAFSILLPKGSKKRD